MKTIIASLEPAPCQSSCPHSATRHPWLPASVRPGLAPGTLSASPGEGGPGSYHSSSPGRHKSEENDFLVTFCFLRQATWQVKVSSKLVDDLLCQWFLSFLCVTDTFENLMKVLDPLQHEMLIFIHPFIQPFVHLIIQRLWGTVTLGTATGIKETSVSKNRQKFLLSWSSHSSRKG